MKDQEYIAEPFKHACDNYYHPSYQETYLL